ncbi:MAG TPA: NAD-dependent epimerase/dehydratase family protein [Longimicrobiales bacterium]|nr:NAD-dependent epimerase/dehydratase family protein [Longimicrobiales bacterium]
MSILITGAAGFIGSHLCERLLLRGHRVVGMDCFDSFYDPWIKERNLAVARGMDGFVELRADIRDPEAYTRLPDDIECVVHLAARAGVRPSIEEPGLYVDVNINGTVALLEFMRARQIHRLVFGSSSSVYGNSAPVPFSEEDHADRPISPYAATKRSGELLVHAHADLFDMSAVCLRFFTVYGPRQRPDLAIHKFARLLAAGEEIPMFGDGSSERDYTEIEDILDGVEAAIHYTARNPRAYEIVNLGGARTIQLLRMIRLIGDAIGVEPRIRQLADQPGDVRRTFADVSKAQRLFGYAPSVPFEEGIHRFGTWYLQEQEHRAALRIA